MHEPESEELGLLLFSFVMTYDLILGLTLTHVFIFVLFNIF